MEKNYCVYKHTTPNGKVYVGITRRDVEKRWLQGRGYKYNHHFTNAIKRYGWDNIKHEVIADKLSEADAKNMERFFIQMYKANNPKYGYNKTFGGDDVSHFEKSVLQYDLDGKLIKRYDSLTEAAKITNTQISRISDCTKGNRFSTHGFIWILEDDEQGKEKLKRAISEKRHPSAMCGGANHQARAIEQYSLDGEYIRTYKSAQTAADILKIDYSSIKSCASDKEPRHITSGGYIWIHKDEQNKEKIIKARIDRLNNPPKIERPKSRKKVSQFTMEGEHIRDFDSIGEAKQYLNTKANIGAVCRGKRKSACGFVWKYI